VGLTGLTGLIDLHVHGAFGVDVLTADDASLDRLARSLELRGVEGFVPTLVPVPLRELAPLLSRLSAWIRSRRPGDGRGAMPLGIHLEGPFVSPNRSGALHRDALLDGSDPKRVDAFFEVVDGLPGRPVVTLAPEIPGGLGLVSAFVRRGFLVSLGHTEADVPTLDEALKRGARHMTHFGNAMKPLHHRDAGPVGWGLLRDGVTVDVISDLHHLSSEMLALVRRCKGPDGYALISDAAPCAGLPDGDHLVWGETLTLSKGAVRNASGGLAGSAALLPDCVERLVACGVATEEEARRAASETPRHLLSSG
jgi:N-acetylglucosamine-6-phosphate deacetylase